MSAYDSWLAAPCEARGEVYDEHEDRCPDCGEVGTIRSIRRGRVVWGWECSECGAYDIQREVEP